MADEKFDEKAMEKQEEKSPQEKSWDEKWRRDPLGTIVWACIFIWAGLVFLAANMGWFDALIRRDPNLPGVLASLEAWSIVFIGVGVIFLIEVVIRLLMPEYRRPVGGTIIFAFILIGIGLGDLFRWEIVGALVLIGIGLSIILRGFRRREPGE